MCNVCAGCINENYLHEQIMQNGELAPCNFCEQEKHPTIGLDALADQIHSVLKAHFYQTSTEPSNEEEMELDGMGCWWQAGESITLIIENLIDSSEEMAEVLRERLYEQHGKYADYDPSYYPCPYDHDSKYEEIPLENYDFQKNWAHFRQEILYRSRFFNQIVKSELEYLFKDVTQRRTRTGESVVRTLSPSDSIFRARLAKSRDALEEILKSTPGSLGAPPSQYASAGRMNAEGIYVFYGATDKDTCVAEIRASVGSYAVIGRFIPLRELRLLDLTMLEEVFVSGSLFDAGHRETSIRAHFLKQLEAELVQPVMLESESRDYLPTQVVAEYLGTHPDMKLDGFMFSSSQTASEDGGEPKIREREGKNIVLFSHACGLEKYDIPDQAEIEVLEDNDNPEKPNEHIIILEKMPREPVSADNVSSPKANFDPKYSVHSYGVPEDRTNAGIRLDMGSIEVERIEGVSYQTFPFKVLRRRFPFKNKNT